MVKIIELISISPFKSFKLLTDGKGLNKEINSIGILDYEAIENQFNLFHKGDLIITTLLFAKNNKNLAENSILSLIEREVSAIAIKTIYYSNLSEKIINFANKKKVPIFLFDDIPFEDIIVGISDELRKKEQTKFYELKIENLLNPQITKPEIIKTLKEINSLFYKNSICLFCIEKKIENKKSLIPKIIKNIRSRKIKEINQINNSIFRYKNGILIIHTFESENSNELKFLENLCRNLNITKENFIIGTSNIHLELSDIPKGIKECICSLNYSLEKNIDRCEFKNIGINKFIMPLSSNYWVKEFSNSIILPIEEYDKNKNSNLMETAIKYIENSGELKKTASDLYQHVNTIRYRLNKIKEIINFKENDENFYEQLFLAIKIFEKTII